MKKESWLSDSSRNDHHPISLSSLVLDDSDQSSEGNIFRGDRFVYSFKSRGYPMLDAEQPNGDSLSTSSPLKHMFKNGDYVVCSTLSPSFFSIKDIFDTYEVKCTSGDWRRD